MDSRVSIPLIAPFIRYSEWKLKMISSLMRQGLYEVSVRFLMVIQDLKTIGIITS